MAHRVEYSKDGKKARVLVDLRDLSLDEDLDPLEARFVTLSNVLVDTWPVRKRGSLERATTAPSNDWTGSYLAYYSGTNRGTTNLPYYDNNAASATRAVDGSAVTIVTGASPAGGSWPYTTLGFPAMMGQDFVVMPDGGGVMLAGGTIHAPNSGAAGVFTTGSTAVTGLSGMTSSMVGSFLVNTQDSLATVACYQIAAVPSATTATLDRVYGGSRSTVASTWTAQSADNFRSGTAIFNSTSSPGRVPAYVVCAMWGRLVLANITEQSPVAGTYYPNRIRWSGIHNSTEGTSPFTGSHGFSTNAYVDVNPQLGKIITLQQHGDALMCVHEFGLTVIYGTPTASDAGSLDVSRFFTAPSRFTSRGCASTPYGFFVLDAHAGLLVWDGRNGLRPVVPGRSIPSNTGVSSSDPVIGFELGYYKDYLFLSSGYAQFLTYSYLFHIPTRRLVKISQNPGLVMQRGRVTNSSTLGDNYLVSNGDQFGPFKPSNMIEAPGVASKDVGGSSTFTASLKTGKIGDELTRLRPIRAYVTYKLTDLANDNPSLSLTLQTGMNTLGAPTLWDVAKWDVDVWDADTGNLFTSASGSMIEAAQIVTKIVELSSTDRDPMIQIGLTQSNAAGVFALYSIVVECDVEGEGVTR